MVHVFLKTYTWHTSKTAVLLENVICILSNKEALFNLIELDYLIAVKDTNFLQYPELNRQESIRTNTLRLLYISRIVKKNF